MHFFFSFVLLQGCLSFKRGHSTCFLSHPCWHREIVTCETIRPLILFKDKLLIDSTVSPGRLMTGAFPSLPLLCFHAQHYRSSCSHLPMNVHYWGCLNCPNRLKLDNNSAAHQETPCHWKAGMQTVQVLTCLVCPLDKCSIYNCRKCNFLLATSGWKDNSLTTVSAVM